MECMKLFNILFAAVFVLFAALQYNDPDPYIWVPLYLYAAALCWLASRRRFYPRAYWLGFAVYGIYGIYKLFDKNGVEDWIVQHHAESIAATMKAEKPWVEESREFFGLLIMIIVLGINYRWLRKQQVK
jgi:hypothetical protein